MSQIQFLWDDNKEKQGGTSQSHQMVSLGRTELPPERVGCESWIELIIGLIHTLGNLTICEKGITKFPQYWSNLHRY